MNLSYIIINGGLSEPEVICQVPDETNKRLLVIPLSIFATDTTKYQLVLLTEDEKKLFNNFQMDSESFADDSFAFKGFSRNEWNQILDTRLGYFITTKSFDLNFK